MRTWFINHRHIFTPAAHPLGQLLADLRDSLVANPDRCIPTPLIIRVLRLLSWIEPRLMRAFARVDAGQPPPPPRNRPPSPPPDPSAPPAKPREKLLRLPRRRGWLIAAMPSFYSPNAGQIRAALTSPALIHYLADPPIARLLHPLCHILGITNLLPPTPPRRQTATPQLTQTPTPQTATVPIPPARAEGAATQPPFRRRTRRCPKNITLPIFALD